LRTYAVVRGQRRFPDKSGSGHWHSIYLRLSRRMFVASCSLRPRTGRANGIASENKCSRLKLRMFFLLSCCAGIFGRLSASIPIRAQAVEPFPSFPRTVRVQLQRLSLGTTTFVNRRSGTSSECQNKLKERSGCHSMTASASGKPFYKKTYHRPPKLSRSGG
jgi:hypothetical protein